MSDEPDESEKTEEPSQKKIDDAHKRGDIAKSQEVNSWFVMTSATLFVALLAPTMASDLTGLMRGVLEHAHNIPVDNGGLRRLWLSLGLGVVGAMLLPFILFVIAAAAGNMIQHPPVWTFDPITPKLSKVSPAGGFKRLFSKESLVNFLKGLVKVSIVATLMVMILWPERDRLDTIVTGEVSALMPMIRDLSLKLLGGVVAVLTIVAGLDFLWQRQRWHQRQRMTIKEVRDEYKQMEGDPTVKAKLRQVRLERSRRRMMQRVPEASVVITNPTHFAVALKYDNGMPAPVCIAKGVDATALKIREIAEANDVAVVENPPLARALHATVELDDEIPAEHYKAVAEVIGYVMRLKKKTGWQAG
ncbi:MAG: flagellar biosynthesis protein FlhB [Hyphomicrobiales bacterium]